ncbi:hypothetical protein WDU94_008007 [Cyamophila willieti]
MTSVFILKTHECCEINTNQRKIIKIDEDDLSVFRRATEDHKQKLRMWNIIVHGAPPKPTLEEEVLWIARELGLFNDWEYDIVGFYRLNSTSKPLVMQMRDSTVKLKWLLEYREKKLWNKRLYMNEHLTLYNLQLFGKCKEWAKANKYKHVSVNDCKIYIQRLHPNDPRGVNDSQYEINKDELSMIERASHDYDQRIRLGNIIVHGAPSTSHSNLLQEVKWIATRLGFLKDWENDIVGYYHFKTNKRNSKPLMLQMKDNIKKQKWLHRYRKRKLWRTGMYLNEHLTEYNFKLFQKSQKWAMKNNYSSVWVHDCKIYIQRLHPNDPKAVNDSQYEIKSFKALESIPSLNLELAKREEPITKLSKNCT